MSKLFKIFVAAAFAMVAMFYGFGSGAAETQHYILKYQGIEREYWLYLPESYENAPLVFVLHGYGGHAEDNMPSMVETAAQNGFALCYHTSDLDTADEIWDFFSQYLK
jgi:poly(3-hydroxybutyrate) depolymerase